MLRGLAAQDRLNEKEFPSLEEFLKNASAWGKQMKAQGCGASYPRVCKAIGKRLFEGKEVQRAELKSKMVKDWLGTLDAKVRKSVEDAINGKKSDDEEEEEEEDEEDDQLWYKDGAVKDENTKVSFFSRSMSSWST